MSTNDTVTATVYLQLAPDVNERVSDTSPYWLRGARVINATQNRATKPKGGTVEVKLEIRVPKAAFLPLQPEAVVVIPTELTTAHPVVVEATDANEGAN